MSVLVYPEVTSLVGCRLERDRGHIAVLLGVISKRAKWGHDRQDSGQAEQKGEEGPGQDLERKAVGGAAVSGSRTGPVFRPESLTQKSVPDP